MAYIQPAKIQANEIEHVVHYMFTDRLALIWSSCEEPMVGISVREQSFVNGRGGWEIFIHLKKN